MPRWLIAICLGVCPVALACNDELVDDVPQTVCFSGKQWIGGKRGSPNMYPGRDCVGCHLENDGPELVFGGTVYEYTFFGPPEELQQLQTGEDCFGLQGVTVRITGADGQEFEVVTNEAGNFFLEGKASDLVKPFNAQVEWISERPDRMDPNGLSPMFEAPEYGGCGRCHSPSAARYPEGAPPEDFTEDERVAPAPRINRVGEVDLEEALSGSGP